MKKGMLEYLNGQKNIVEDTFILCREGTRGTTRSEYIQIRHPEVQEPLYNFWNGQKKQGKKPKHTGGKKPYVMLMVEKLVKMMNEGVPAECTGHMMYLVPYVDWHTGRLLYGREKRQMVLTDIEKVFKRSRRKTLYILSTLKKHGLLARENQGYFISRDLIKKGGAGTK